MSTTHVRATTRSGWLGTGTIALASVGLASVLWLLLVTATSLDPPEWLRIGGMALLPVGIFGAVMLGGIGVTTSAARHRSIIGLLVAATAVVVFVGIYNVYD